LMLPWRLTRAGALRAAVGKALDTPEFADRASEIARWSEAHDGPTQAARLVEELAAD
jgi:UDP:flavonoid glycosyltransferase YjiC (YdhE family)